MSPNLRKTYVQMLGLRMGWNCHYCGVWLDWSTVTIDHIWPRCYGGINRLRNLVLACGPCNSSRGHKTLKCGCRKCMHAYRSGFDLLLRRLLGQHSAAGGVARRTGPTPADR